MSHLMHGAPPAAAPPCGVTVVIPAYRAELTVRRAIDSALTQQRVTVSVVVVEDGTFDRTAEIVAAYDNTRVSLARHAVNRGGAAARNTGLSQVSSTYTMFLDADDYLEGPLLFGLVTQLQQTQADIAFGPSQILHEGSNKYEAVVVPDFRSPQDVIYRWHVLGQYVPTCSVLWRTSFLEQIGGWNPLITRNDDGELAMRAMLRGACITQSALGCGIYVKHSSQSVNNRTDNLPSLLEVNRALLATSTTIVSPEFIRYVCGQNLLNVAWHALRAGDHAVARQAVSAAAELGEHVTRSRKLDRLAFKALGPRVPIRVLLPIRRRLDAYLHGVSKSSRVRYHVSQGVPPTRA